MVSDMHSTIRMTEPFPNSFVNLRDSTRLSIAHQVLVCFFHGDIFSRCIGEDYLGVSAIEVLRFLFWL